MLQMFVKPIVYWEVKKDWLIFKYNKNFGSLNFHCVGSFNAELRENLTFDFSVRIRSCLRQLFKAEKTDKKGCVGAAFFSRSSFFLKSDMTQTNSNEKFVRLLQLLLRLLLQLLLWLLLLLQLMFRCCINSHDITHNLSHMDVDFSELCFFIKHLRKSCKFIQQAMI